MQIRFNTYAKIISLLAMLLIPILLLFTLFNQVSVSVLRNEVKALKQKDLSFLANEVNSSVENLSTMAFLLSEDIHIQQLQQINLLENNYERYLLKSRIMERLRLLNVTERWDTQFSVIAPQIGEIVSTNSHETYDPEELKRIMAPRWTYQEMDVAGRREHRFVRHVVKPLSTSDRPEQAGLIVEVSFPDEYMIKELDLFKLGGKGDPFLYHPSGACIVNHTADLDNIHSLLAFLDFGGFPESFNRTVELNGKEYLASAWLVPTLGWYLIDYVPMEEILRPIVLSRNLFYVSAGLLLILSLLAAYLLYRNVQRPIGMLIRGVQRIRAGDYSVRVTGHPKNEFVFLFHRFNEMAAEIESLIHKVYAEQLRAQDAQLKQLQSQINPHFLYNCFALIRSLTRLGKKESVMDLTMHLSKYYRYTTRTEKPLATLREELQLIESYLEIQKLHIKHLDYRIHVPEEMMELEVPRMLLQPLVENAVIHGIERSDRDGIVTITGQQSDHYYEIVVEDNGVGMTEAQLQKLRRDLEMPLGDETGCALWNIQKRLVLQFGDQAGLSFADRHEGGMAVRIQWPAVQEETFRRQEGNAHVPSAYRGRPIGSR